MDNRPIGIFDSGVGGLTVVRQVMKKLPGESIVYFGDTARVPYGTKSRQAVTRFSKQDVRFLLTKQVKAVIIACNTVSSNSLEELQGEFDIPLFGVVGPGVQDAVKTTENGRVGVIGTAATIRSGAYERFIQEQKSEIQVFSKACPLFVSLVEEGWTENEIALLTAQEYLKELLECEIDCLVLGCTHYPLLKKCIGETIGQHVKLVDPAASTALEVKDFLEKTDALRAIEMPPQHSFFVSDTTDKFEMLCEKALKRIYPPIVIDIEAY